MCSQQYLEILYMNTNQPTSNYTVKVVSQTSEFFETTFLTTAGNRSEQSLPLAIIWT